MMTDLIVLPRRITVGEYHRLADAGVFGELRVELLDGRVTPMSPMNPAHASALVRVRRLFDALFDENEAAIRPQCPVTFDEGWEPHPDFVVAKPGDWEDTHPRAEDIHLIIEVSETTLREDLAIKVPCYARNGVTEVWVVDLAADVVHVHRDPSASDHYRIGFDAKLDETIGPVAFAGVAIPAARLFPASRGHKHDTAPSRSV
jgi:Uma2 family endonuclease